MESTRGQRYPVLASKKPLPTIAQSALEQLAANVIGRGYQPY